MIKKFLSENTLFDGVVTHTRFHPVIHKFKYYVTYFWFDLRNFDELFFFKKNKFSFFSFYEKDHGTKHSKKSNLFQSIINNLRKIRKDEIKYIRILCLPRILGYAFNPISVYVCYDKFRSPKIVIFEVNNTFNERYSYYCSYIDKKKSFNFKKRLYVSPFFKVEGYYKIKLEIFENKISFFINYIVKKKKVFTASFVGKSFKLNSSNIIRLFLKNIHQNLKITIGIYFQALKLFVKGVKYIKKPSKSKKEFSSIR